MPMHDWTRIDPDDYRTFHFAWIAAIVHDLNNGRLPAECFAMVEPTTPPVVRNRVTHATADTPIDLGPGPTGDILPTTMPPPSGLVMTTAVGKPPKAVGRWRVVIQHARNRQTVAVIEIVSPSNKNNKPEFNDLVRKSVQLLFEGVHVLLIDPFPPSAHDSQGIHAAVWNRLTRKPFTPPDGKPLTLASYVARGANTFSTFVEPLAVGDPLRDMPLFLTDELHILAPLEETYQAAWQGFPSFLRAIATGPP